MDLQQAMLERHSVRAYTDQPVGEDVRQELNAFVDDCNRDSGLHIQICYDSPEAFESLKAHYGKFSNVRNYIAMIGPDNDDLDELCGYYGEKIVLHMQQIGLNSCWVYMTYNKNAVECTIAPGDKICIVIAFGYGQNHGTAHLGKDIVKITDADGSEPDWFIRGLEAAMLAPTAMNQQKFTISYRDGKAVIQESGRGLCTKIDLGIVKYHFEAASGRKPELHEIQPEDRKELLKLQQTETDDVLMYQQLAGMTGNDRLKQMFLNLAEESRQRALLLYNYTQKELKPRGISAKSTASTGRFIGWYRLLMRLARRQGLAEQRYKHLTARFPKVRELLDERAKDSAILKKIADRF